MISSLQKEKAAQSIRLQKLKQGESPSNKEIVEEMLKKEKGHLPGKPYYTPLGIEPHSVTNSTVWNRSFRNLRKDLETLYDANILMNNRLISHQEKSDIENNILNFRLDLLSMKYQNLKDMARKTSGMQGFVENFKDFRHIDSSSTADINLKEKSVTLEKLNTSRRYDISGSQITVRPLTAFTDQEHYGEDKSILNDFYNEFEVYKFVTDNNGTFTIEAKADLQESLVLNAVQLAISSSSKIKATLYISENGISFKEQYDTEDNRVLEWIFGETSVKAIKIILRSASADSYLNGQYSHHFILKSLGLYRNFYEQEGILMGKPVRFLGAVDRIKLQAEDVIFNDTNIIYSVGVERNDRKIQWTVAENGDFADLNLLSQVDEIVNRNDKNYGQNVGDGLYRIYQLPPKTNIDSIKINPGYQMWYRERLEGIGGHNYTLNLTSYDSSKIVSKDFVDTEEYRIGLSSRNLDVLTQYVECAEDTSATFPYAFVEGASEHFQQVIFCNGTKIAQKKGSFTVSLKKGMNKIIMFLYLGSGPGQETYSAQVTTKVNFREITDDVHAFPKMKYVNPYTLRKDSLPENYLYYTIEDEHILIKHNPEMNAGNYNNEMRYYLSYRHLNEDSPYVQYKNGEPFVKVRIKALLVSSRQDFTPKILSYRLSSE